MKFSVDQVFGSLPPGSVPLVEAVLAEARRRRLDVYLVGGPVRDLVLGSPVADVDLVVVSAARSVEDLARGAAPPGSRVDVHDRFGTATLSTVEGSVDLAMVRSEIYKHPGALPKVVARNTSKSAGSVDIPPPVLCDLFLRYFFCCLVMFIGASFSGCVVMLIPSLFKLT